MATKHKIKVYSTKTCPYCHMAKDFLKQNKIEFEDIDVGTDEEAANEMVEKSGQMGVPVLEIDGEIVVGFDKEKIKKLLGVK
ncbi:NrdH-redoxin [Candidatus Woesearchaeota archaeon]|nr:NrdH-redoxin [Candidatus Woesearchaeota archaeon]